MTDLKEERKSEYIRINRDIFFEEAGELKRLNKGTIGKLLGYVDLNNLLDSLPKERALEIFDELEKKTLPISSHN